MRSNGKVIVLSFFMLVLFYSCGSNGNQTDRFTDRFHVVKDVEGNTIVLRNNLKISLLGVNDSKDVEAWLKSQSINQVKIVFDSDYLPRRLTPQSRILGYVIDEHGNHLNAAILKNNISTLNSENLSDSLFNFKQYASGSRPVSHISTPSVSSESVIQQLSKATFQIESYGKQGNMLGIGSGFFIASSGIGTSNYHVFEEGVKWKIIRCDNGKTYTIGLNDIISYNKKIDYIIFNTPATNPDYLSIASRIPKQGAEVFVYGNPRGLECTLSKGIVSAVRSIDTKNDYIQVDAAISPGSSGGPIVNTKGEAIAITTMKIHDCENCNFGISTKLIERFAN